MLKHLTFNGIFRFILAEGEGLVISLTSTLSLAQQGEYSLIANLCSMVCRFLYQPMEEMSYNYYSKGRGNQMKYFGSILKFILYLGVVLVAFSQVLSYQLLYFLYRDTWATPSTVLIL